MTDDCRRGRAGALEWRAEISGRRRPVADVEGAHLFRGDLLPARITAPIDLAEPEGGLPGRLGGAREHVGLVAGQHGLDVILVLEQEPGQDGQQCDKLVIDADS
jgi:hypothetical protein